MKLIYTHENRIMALNIRNVLINHGFDVALNNEFASSASGGLAPFDTWPEVWLLKDDDFDNAKKIIESISYNSIQAAWECKKCQEENDESFDYCWKCHEENE
ncbi:DUF2007 domain-containing protein [Candidatus Thioglobus sp.]|jgi:hypothetical protein|uniref:putative signal transducing protein n=1 Tax=Candidatus Pseudothioglobus singularis TaxID=1427364 RepID=UPI00010404C9|nr:DUF2007 domain-containing protein [Candidatus Pseudothioglobus singularis]MDA9642098.1 DUF2007 domain-containing protein [Candidatus Thioglobus sp.]MDC3334830.1 DUF2007 domain-containing protein [bacterium]ANQ66415.1 hypothetical protein GS41_03650 [Candidatus Pseudothioglobus singularis]MDA7441348.1 DUF2007 domain-containing protein [Candidatus Pseudothioglobus singularis]MDA8813631.1 DUF2007 domain-containing protein [Candidatus Pseudothioglobus singularis]|tara:strand:+ start:1696 stop:2001 length:306 start_codon:yes stop_codon:yes gene_type:complete